MKALLFINGTPPKTIPNLEDYQCIACTDGAFNYLLILKFPLTKLCFVSGDLDSIHNKEVLKKASEKNNFEIINTPNQNKTDFEKAMEILLEKGVKDLDVLGGSGKEMDHFLGNLTAAFHFKDKMNIHFYDEFSTYYFIPNSFKINGVISKTISLYPFPKAQKITTKGLNWTLNQEDLDMTSRIGTRNLAIENEIFIEYEKGNLLIFIEN